MHRMLIVAAAVMLLVSGSALLPQAAAAHPLGNFTINRYARLDLTPGVTRLRYVLDMAEIPTFQERSNIDRDGDGALSDAERDAYATQLANMLRENVSVTVGGKAIALRLVERDLSFLPGQGGLETLRLAIWFDGPLPRSGDPLMAVLRDDNFADRIGWKEIVVRGGPGIDISDSSVLNTDTSNELQSYPQELLKSPLSQREARFTYAPGVGMDLGTTPPATNQVSARVPDRFATLIAQDLTLPVALLSLLIAMGLGALHALGPGHGKTIVAAYLVGSRGTTKHALILGLTVTVTHTSSVFVLGVVTLYLSEFILPETLFPWLSFLSGASVAALGLGLLWSRARSAWRGRRGRARALVLEPAGGHSRARQYTPERGLGVGSQSHIGLDPRMMHRHGSGSHTHLPPGGRGERLTWRSLLTLGISGGILPCPSALVVLLTAISLQRIGYGMLLIVAFSFGLAAVLMGIGILLVHARGLLGRVPLDSTIARFAPVVSAAIVVVLGAGIAYRALFLGNGLSI